VEAAAMTRPPEDQPDDDAIRIEIDVLAAERVIFFSDAVVAIAITLLALALPLPHGRTNAEILRSMSHDSAAYLAFLISFVVVGSHWRWHHRVFKYVARLDERIIGLNMIWLLMVVVTPFAARLLRRRGLLRLEPPDAHQIDVRLLTLAGLFAISIPIAFVTPLAFAIWIAGPVLSRVWRLAQSMESGGGGMAAMLRKHLGGKHVP
jgi:TMEM175 potassium channel family protein